VTNEHTHLWNDMPFEERKRLMPYMIETHILHLQQVRSMIIEAHKAELRKLDGWIKNCEESLEGSLPQPGQTRSGK
jgi:hypothetical protein